MRTISLLSVLSVLTVGCTAESASHVGVDEAVGQSSRTIEDDSADATIVLYLANTLTEAQLDDDATLDRRAAANIVAHRAGPDGVEGTSDDDTFDDLDELDAVSYVGASALTDLRDYGRGRGMTGEAVHGVLVGTIEAEAALFLATRLSETALDFDVALDRRAAENLVDARGYGGFPTLADLDAVPYVSSRAFGKLVAYADAHGMLDDAGLAVRGGTPYATLQDAVDASSTAISVYLFAGTYTGPTEVDATLIVRGYARDRTVLDGEGVDALLSVDAGSPCFYDLTLRDGTANNGGAAVLWTSGVVLFDNVAFEGNTSTYGGGAIYASSATTLRVYEGHFEGNESGSLGGGIYALGDVSLDGVSFEDNAAYGASALYVWDTATLTDVAVRYNEDRSAYYGALTLRGDVDATGVDFYANTVNDLSLDFGDVWDGLGADVSFTCDADGCDGLE